MANIPTNIRDIIFINGFVNIINKSTHVDNRTGNYSLLDPILITDPISIIDSDTIHIDREFSDHDGTYVTIGFLPGYSTTHQLIELNDDILLALDKKQITSITFADISKSL
jgi:hypothetical protein